MVSVLRETHAKKAIVPGLWLDIHSHDYSTSDKRQRVPLLTIHLAVSQVPALCSESNYRLSPPYLKCLGAEVFQILYFQSLEYLHIQNEIS